MKEFYAGEQPGLLGGVIVQAVSSSLMYAVSYSEWLREGEVLSGATVTVDAGVATITKVSFNPQEKTVYFFLNGGNLGDQFNVIVNVNTTLGQTRYDHIAVIIVTNGGNVAVLGTQANNLLSIIGPTGPAGPTGP